MVHTQAVVGEIADDTAVLTSETLQLFRMPLALLPHPLTVGTVIDLHAAVNPAARAEREASVREVPRALCARLQLSPPGPAEPEQVDVPCSHPLPPLPSGALLEVSALPPASSSAEVVLGGRVWKAAPALCAWMASAAHLFAGRAVLELGAGTGACGLYAAALGASRVVLTEGGDEAAPLLALMQDNVARNSGLLAAAGARVEVASLHWGREPLPAGPFDVVIGSDVTWGSDDEAHAGLAATLAALLRRDAGVRAVLAMEHGLPLPVEEPPHATPPLFRDETLEQFRAAAAAHGLRVDRLGASGPTADALVWPAESFTAFSPHTTSEVFLVQVTLGPPA